MRNAILKAIVSAFLLLSLCGTTIAYSQTDNAFSTVGVAIKETSLGNLTADAIRKATNADIAIVPAGLFKETSIPVNKMKSVNPASFLQYPDDLIVTITLTGDQIRQALERSVSLYPQKNMGFLQVSGLTFAFNPTAPRGQRVGSIKINGKDLQPGNKYTVGMTQPFAKGGYGYFVIWGSNQANIVESGKTVREAVMAFISSDDITRCLKLDRILIG